MAVLQTLLALRFKGRGKLGLISLLAVSILATTGVVAGLEVRDGAGGRLDDLFVETGSPDLTVTGGPDGVPQALTEATAAGLIDDVTIYDATFASFARPDGTGVGMNLVAVDDASSLEVGRPILRDGRWPEASNEMVLDTGAALEHGHTVGSVVTIDRNGTSHELTVVGTAVDLAGCFYPTCLPLRGYVTSDGLTQVAPEGVFARAHVRLGDGPSEEAGAQFFQDSGLVDAVDPWSTNRSNLLLPGRIFSAFLAGFGAFVLIATLLVVASTAVGSVVARRRELGLLKALGTTPNELLAVTVLEQVVVGLFGVAIGWVAGSLLAPWLQLGLVEVLGRATPTFDIATLFGTALVMVLVLVVATIVPARRAGSLEARAALADAPPVAAGGFRSLVARLPLAPPSQLGVQLALARPVRAVLASMAIAVAVAAGLAGWRLSSAVDTMLADPARAGDPYDVLLGAPPAVPAEMIEEQLASVDGVASWYTEAGDKGRIIQARDGSEFGDTSISRQLHDDGAGAGRAVAIRAIGDRVDSADLVVVEGRMPETPLEALAGWGVLRSGDIRIGDAVAVQLDGTLAEGEVDAGAATFEVIIVGRHGELDNSGDVLVVSMPTYVDAVGDARQRWNVSGDGSVDRAELARRIERSFDGRALVQPATEAAGQLRPFRLVLAVLVGLVAAVAAANLGATLVAGARERRRELGVVRALGFSPGELRQQAASGGVVLGLIGVAIGIPAGLFASTRVVATAADQIGLGPGLLSPSAVAPALITSLLGVVLAALVAVAATRSLRSVPAPELVREI